MEFSTLTVNHGRWCLVWQRNVKAGLACVTTSAGCRKLVGTPPSLMGHFSSDCWPTSTCGLLSTGLLPSLFYLLPPVTRFYSSLLSLSAQPSTNFICCLVLRSLPQYTARQKCFLVALSPLSFCPWQWLSSPISPLPFRILDISIMREVLVRLGGPQTRPDSGRR